MGGMCRAVAASMISCHHNSALFARFCTTSSVRASVLSPSDFVGGWVFCLGDEREEDNFARDFFAQHLEISLCDCIFVRGKMEGAASAALSCFFGMFFRFVICDILR